jgi:hypothetical protein
MPTGNPLIQQRLDDLVGEGESIWDEYKAGGGSVIKNPIRLAQWLTSCLNLFDKLSVSSNRFVKEFERYLPASGAGTVNVGVLLGVLKAARVEYSLGLAVEYHLSVSAAVFDGILDEADYLLAKGYHRAGAVLMGAALEESLKTRAKALGLEVGPKETLSPIIAKLKASDVQVLNEFEAKRLESIAKMRNEAAHGGEFNYQGAQVSQALSEVRAILEQLLRRG